VEAKNLLVIMSDEHNPKMLGTAGHPLIQTPNLDRLARRGTQFTNAYTTCPICVPARASFATGRRVHEIGYWDNSMGYDGQVQSWGHQLRDAGHIVESVGKLHYRCETDDTGFNRQHIPMHIVNGVGKVHLSIRRQFPDFIATMSPNGIIPQAGPGESDYTRYDRNICRLACEWLREASMRNVDKPWLLFVSFVTPHYPLVAPEEFFSRYPLDEMPAPKCDPASDFKPHPWLDNHIASTAAHLYSKRQHQNAAAAYMGLCSFMDSLVGTVLKTLESTGLSETTRVLYTSDHGENAGARGMWGKSNHYEEASGIPMIVAGPDVPIGTTCKTPVTLIDAHPTILHGVGLPYGEDGTRACSLFDIAQAPDQLERVAFSEYHAAWSPSGSFMVRCGPYKYIHYVGFEPELFDLDTDPEELRNLAGDPEYLEIRCQLEAELRAICDPDATDAAANAAQKKLIESRGGPAQVLGNLVTDKHYTPVPEGMAS